jgi:hypothetical protein
MSNLLPLFDSDAPEPTSATILPAPMSPSQRDAIRKAFGQLGITDVRGQFAMVKEMTGQEIGSVQQLESRHAQTLIYRLTDKINTSGRKNTGNAWDDREEDTWIDKL